MRILLSAPMFDFPEGVSLYAQELYTGIKEAEKSVKVVSYVVYDNMFFDQLEGKLSTSDRLEVQLIIDKEGFSVVKRYILSLKEKFPGRFMYKTYNFDNSSLHAKFIIFDDKKAIIGSHNITQNALFKNIELAVLIDDREGIKVVSKIFNKIWGML